MSLPTFVKSLIPHGIKVLVWKARRRLALRRLRATLIRDRAAGRKTILFHLSFAGQSAYIVPVLQELRAREANISIYLIADEHLSLSNATLSALIGIPEIRILRWDERADLGAVDAFVTPTQWIYEEPAATTRVCIFHGQPTKGNTFLPDLMCRFNSLFLLGPLQRSLYDEFAAAHPEIAMHIRTFDVGYPKSDGLVCGQFSRSDILAKLRLDPAMPMVLYAPAFDKGTALDMYGEEVVEKLLEVDANVVVKLHPMCYDPRGYPNGVNWTERLRKFESHPRFRHVGNQPLGPFLAASDVLITDTSGSGFEFMMLDKPVVFIDCPDFFKGTLGQTMYVRPGEDVLRDIRANAGRSAGIVVPGPSHLPEAVTRSLEFPMEFSPQRQAVRSQLLYNPGKGAAAAVDALLGLIET